MAFDIDMIKAVYERYPERIAAARKAVNKPLTLSEKILYTHLWDGAATQEFSRGGSYVDFAPDRVAMQDATAQMALLQFMQAGKEKVAVPSTAHADHLIQAKLGADKDLQESLNKNNEVFNFLSSVCNKYGIGFWKPGAGIIHQVVLENYAFPGGMMIGTDSHTVNAGGLGMVAIGVGGADAVDVMAGMPWELRFPKLIGVKLTGNISGWTSAKDVILKVADILTVKGGTGAIIEYFGPGAINLSATGKGTICNMGAEVGATTSVFDYDDAMERFLRATEREGVADAANEVKEYLTGDAEVYENPEEYFDQVIEINLDTLQPHLNGPFTPDLATPVGELGEKALANDWPLKVEWGLIGSCTNSSYEDLSRAASIAKQAVDKKIVAKSDFGINPGSEQIRYTAERDGILKSFTDLNATIFTNACGPCIGQWDRSDMLGDEKNTIVHSFNRNFSKRADGNPNTHAFVGSPEMVAAITIAGRLDFNPMTDTLINEDGEEVRLDPPMGLELPPLGFDVKDNGYLAPTEDGSSVEVIVNKESDRIQLLDPFEPIKPEELKDVKLLIKAEGKCPTDHISMAGPWLRYRGHLDNIANNTLIGAVNAYSKATNEVVNQLTGEKGEVPATARAYKAAGIPSIVVGDHNYGEGSSREHAAMEPRHLGVIAVIVKSFARIHETNLKKQGMLGLTFANEADYDLIQEDDTFNFVDIADFAPNKPLTIEVVHKDGSKDVIMANHTYNDAQIKWYREGSALNLIKKQNA